MSYSHIMLDLETMSTSPQPAIVSIGAVEFGPDGLGAEFYRGIDLLSAVREGGEMSAETVLWWLGQSDDSRTAIELGKRPIAAALLDFRDFVAQRNGEPVIWANAPSFDCVILRSAYERCGLRAPWSYRNERCYRTLTAMYPDIGAPEDPDGTPHHALDDAKRQARYVVKILSYYTPVLTGNGRRDSDSD